MFQGEVASRVTDCHPVDRCGGTDRIALRASRYCAFDNIPDPPGVSEDVGCTAVVLQGIVVMKCQRCANPATFHITELVKEVVHEYHFCEECAQQYLTHANAPAGESLSEDSPEAVPELEPATCPNCGITFQEFRKQGRLGCPHDYVVFQKELYELLENIHGETQHVGKVPKRTPDDSRKQFQLIKLRNDLKTAVTDEMYEQAARIRDEIQTLERELRPPTPEPEQ